MNVGDVNGNELADKEVDSRIMSDGGEKCLKLRDAPATFKSKVWTHFGFYNTDVTYIVFLLIL